MRIELNGKPADVSDSSVFGLVKRLKPGGYATVDGYGISEDMPLKEGMSVCVFSKIEAPSEEEFDALLSARESPEIRGKMKRARVGIAGLGGLGSNVAVMLARAGIGHLVLVDKDTVDVTNLNRQDYTREDIGRNKTDALSDRIRSFNPHMEITTRCIEVTEKNASSLFSDCDIVVEAFDNAESKAMLINTILAETDKWVVSGNGVAGYGPANDIRTSQPMERLIICGDGETEARPGCGLTAAHVMIASAHQANATIRLILGINPP